MTMQEKKAVLLRPEQLRRICNVESLKVHLMEPFAEGPVLSTPVGQKRAMESLRFGLDMDIKGYNIFVMGPAGSGKTSITLKLIKEKAIHQPKPKEIVYVYNFEESYRPKSLLLQSGTGVRLEKALKHTIAGLSKSIFQTIYDAHFLKLASLVTARSRNKMEELFVDIDEVAEAYQLRVEHEGDQFMVIPLIEGEPIDPEVYEELPTDLRNKIQEQVSAFQHAAAPLIKAQRDQEQVIEEQLKDLEKQAIEGLVNNSFHALKESFSSEHSSVLSYFEGMQSYLMEHYRELNGRSAKKKGVQEEPTAQPLEMDNLPLAYQINLLVKNKGNGVPVVIEKEPTLHHLFGYLEYSEEAEGLATDHMLLRPGSLHQAHGGYLVLQAGDLIRRPEVWEVIKQTLRNREIRMQDPYSSSPDKPRVQGTIRPLEVPLDVKIILIGSLESYFLLHHEDDDFQRIFKIKAEFDSWVPWEEKHEIEYCRFLQRVCREESLLPLSYDAIGLMVEVSAREVESQLKLSTSLIMIIDVLCESDYWARKENANTITSKHIEKAHEFRAYREEIVENNLYHAIERGETLIDTDGEMIGQINGLLVYSSMDYRFGLPTKITARSYAGNKGVLNIDREVRLSGSIHDKGSMILVGLLGGLWGQKHPMAFNASITFEQIYGEIEGDSASCAEFYALLSSLGNKPINQGIAVTGSINQLGLIQPIGDVNRKIEGMFKICEKRGLTGKQGVIIPVQNVEHLMLEPYVIEAVKAGQFHIWSIRRMEEAIEILMGLPAGKREDNGQWTSGSLFDLIEQRLERLYTASKQLRV